MGHPDAPEPRWPTSDPEAFMEAVRASDGAVWAVRTWTRLYDAELGREVPKIQVSYAMRAESEAGWGTYAYTEVLDVEEVTGRIAAGPGTVWRWLRAKKNARLHVSCTGSGTPWSGAL